MHSVVLHFMTWPHTFHPSTPSIHPSVHSVSLYDRHTHSLVVFFFFSISFIHQRLFLRVYIAEVSTVKEEKKKKKKKKKETFLVDGTSFLFLFLSLSIYRFVSDNEVQMNSVQL